MNSKRKFLKHGGCPDCRPLDSLRGRHNVPAAALVHRNPFLGLLAEIHRLLAATAAFDQWTEVSRSRPVAVAVGVGVASVTVVTAVVALGMENTDSVFIDSSVKCLTNNKNLIVIYSHFWCAYHIISSVGVDY